MKLTVESELDSGDLANSLKQEQALNLIEEIDLSQADTDFTELVITRLAESLSAEYGSGTIREFLKVLRNNLK